MNHLICVGFVLLSLVGHAQKNIFSIGYSNQVGINQYNSIRNETTSNDNIYSGYSYTNVGLRFERKIHEKHNLWLTFSLNYMEENFRFDYFYLIDDPSKDPIGQLQSSDFDNLPKSAQKSCSWLQMADMKLGLKKNINLNFWELELQPEVGVFTKSDVGLYSGFQYASVIFKGPFVWANITRYTTDFQENNNNLHWYAALRVSKKVYRNFLVSVDLSYMPRIQMNYEVSTVINLSEADLNGGNLLYYEQVNNFTKAQLSYDLFRFGVHFGYSF